MVGVAEVRVVRLAIGNSIKQLFTVGEIDFQSTLIRGVYSVVKKYESRTSSVRSGQLLKPNNTLAQRFLVKADREIGSRLA